MTNLLKKIGKMEKTITIFNTTIMHGNVGVVKNVKMPSLEGGFSTRLICFSSYRLRGKKVWMFCG